MEHKCRAVNYAFKLHK